MIKSEWENDHHYYQYFEFKNNLSPMHNKSWKGLSTLNSNIIMKQKEQIKTYLLSSYD